MAKAAKVTIVEAENIVEAGEIDPNEVDLPGILVDRIRLRRRRTLRCSRRERRERMAHHQRQPARLKSDETESRDAPPRS